MLTVVFEATIQVDEGDWYERTEEDDAAGMTDDDVARQTIQNLIGHTGALVLSAEVV